MFDAVIREATGSVQHSYEECMIDKSEMDEYFEDVRNLQKQVKGDEYDEVKDNKNIGY